MCVCVIVRTINLKRNHGKGREKGKIYGEGLNGGKSKGKMMQL